MDRIHVEMEQVADLINILLFVTVKSVSLAICVKQVNRIVMTSSVDLVCADVCLSEPCQNGGRCVREENGYSCKCSNQFQGTNCQGYRFLLQ